MSPRCERQAKTFGSVKNAISGHYKMPDGSRIEVVGIAQDGKHGGITEDPQMAMFLPIVQWPSNSNWLVVRSSRNPQQMGAAIRNTLHQLDAGLPVDIEKRYDEIREALFPSQMATMSLGVMGVMGAMLSITGIFGMAAYSVSKRLRELGIRVASARSVRKCCRQRWDGLQITDVWLGGRIVPRNSGEPGAG